MTDEELLRGLAQAARDAERPPIEAPELSDEARERIAASILGRASLRIDADATSGAASSASTTKAILEERRSISDGTTAKPRGRLVFLFAPLAAAAAVLVYLGMRPAGDLPQYAVTLSSSVQTDRAAAPVQTDEVVLQPDAWFEMVARPAQPTAELSAHAVILRDGTKLVFNGDVDVSEEGAVRLSGQARNVFPETVGTYEIVLTITRRGASDSRVVHGRVRFASDR